MASASIARKDGARVRLYSRPGNDLTYRFTLIVESLARLRSRSCIIDGEAVCCDNKVRRLFIPGGPKYPLSLSTQSSGYPPRRAMGSGRQMGFGLLDPGPPVRTRFGAGPGVGIAGLSGPALSGIHHRSDR